MKTLIFFSIGPVQTFITQSRKFSDLYYGSSIFSKIIKATLTNITKNNSSVCVISPYFDKICLDKNHSLPNRFILSYSGEFTKEQAEDIESGIREEYLKLMIKGISENKILIECKEQIKGFPNIKWLIVPMEGEFKETWDTLNKYAEALSAINQFGQSPLNSESSSRGCSQCGTGQAIVYHKNSNAQKNTHNAYSLRRNEALCGVCFGKRVFNDDTDNFPSISEVCLFHLKEEFIHPFLEVLNDNADIKQCFPKQLLRDYQLGFKENATRGYLKENYGRHDQNSTNFIHTYEELYNQKITTNNSKGLETRIEKSKYYAMLMFDGDSIGDRFSGEISETESPEKFIIQLSKNFFDFSKGMSDYLQEPLGRSIYAGGDDFLGVVNLNALFDVLQKTETLLNEHVNGKLPQGKKITLSGGVVIFHYKTPLYVVMEKVRQAEKKAKNYPGKNALRIEAYPGGNPISCSFRWQNIEAGDSSVLTLKNILQSMKELNMSSKIFRTLKVSMSSLCNQDGTLPDSHTAILEAEMKRITDHSFNDADRRTEARKDVSEPLMEFYRQSKPKMNTAEFFDLLFILDFMNRHTEIIDD